MSQGRSGLSRARASATASMHQVSKKTLRWETRPTPGRTAIASAEPVARAQPTGPKNPMVSFLVA